jgi:DMSO/TMAO reductase YedYZ molybdopterin-dependent catalytic subunit
MEIRTVRSPDIERGNRVPPGQRVTGKWPVLHFGNVPKVDKAKWTLRVFGLVEREETLSFDEFQRLPATRVLSDIHCVTRWSRLDNTWDGVTTSTLKEFVRMLPEARFVIVHGAPAFTTNLTIDDFFQTDVLLATSHDSEAINAKHGGPVRLVVPRLYFWKSAKWVTGIEFVSTDVPGFWESRGYHNHGDPWTEERYS